METLLQDLRYGARTMLRAPAFSFVAITTLALAICVNTAIFSAVNAVVFADLPMEDPGSVALLFSANRRLDTDRGAFTLREYLEYRENNRSFDGLAAWSRDQWILTGADEPLRVDGYRITANFFRVWGMATVAGRPFLPDDNRPGAPPIAILSHGFWNRLFGARQNVIGSTLRLDGIEHTVVGILSPQMEWASLADVEIWTPLSLDLTDETIDSRVLALLGRLGPGITVAQADLDIRGIDSRTSEQWPAPYRSWEPHVFPVSDTLLDADDRRVLLLLVVTVGFVLLIASANVANMLLARATTRAREIAIRGALGAARARLVRQMLAESFLIAAAASAIGLAMSRGLMRMLFWISEEQSGLYELAVLDGNVLLFTIFIALATTLAFGLFPAFRASALDLSAALNERTGRAGGRSGNRTRGLLVATQVSLALMLMVVAGLIVRSVINQQQRELGFDASGVLTMRIDLPDSKYPGDVEREQFFRQTMQQTEQLPAVEEVALVSRIPLVDGAATWPFDVEGSILDDEANRPSAEVWIVSREYLGLMRIPVLAGRGFSTDDTPESMGVALVSRETARRFWGGRDPISQRIALGTSDSRHWLQIVGVTGDVANADGGLEPAPAIYVPFTQNTRSNMTVLVRTSGDPLSLAGPVRSVVWQTDPEQPIDDVRTIEQALRHDWASLRAVVTMFVAFALFALLMAAVGIYGVTSYSVSQRTGEICIRMALGAGRSRVWRMMLGQGVRQIVLGTVVGLVGALGLTRLLTSLVVGISSVDPVTFVAVPVILATVGLAANYIPVRRAARIDPMTALRLE